MSGFRGGVLIDTRPDITVHVLRDAESQDLAET
jgi:hypothetical protein